LESSQEASSTEQRDEGSTQKRQTQSQRKPRRGSRGCIELEGPASSTQRLHRARRACVIDAEAAGVTQKPREDAQSFSRLTQRVSG